MTNRDSANRGALATGPTQRRAERCVTHHCACDCREWDHACEVERLERALAESRERSERLAEAVAWQYEQNGHWFLVASAEPWRSKGMRVRALYPDTTPAPDVALVSEGRQIVDELIQCANVGRWDGKLVSAAKDWLAQTEPLTATQKERK
ncbi:MAG: hypothetical protein R3212_05620 [Xanthomonadales bacterium]|nr:hypothetical protein [Xanthomonadales bacterium]